MQKKDKIKGTTLSDCPAQASIAIGNIPYYS